MAPTTRKRKSDEIEDKSHPATPTTGSRHKKLKVTKAQKQVLIDNLQLEIDERKRRLRAHYALQCADLRSRIERRINRIPIAMRKMTMGEVMAKHEAAIKAQQPIANKQAPAILPPALLSTRLLPQLPQQETAKYALPKPTQANSPVATSTVAANNLRGRKRKTSEIHIASDGEVENQPELDNLPVAKKTRGKGGATTATGTAATATTARATSRAQNGATSVLSPRSHNSRTLTRPPLTKDWKSPAKPSSPIRSAIARPISPIKPASPLKSAAFAISAAAHGMARGAAATATKLSGGRTASKEKEKTATTATSPAASSKAGRMPPPPRPLNAPTSPTRQPSVYTTISEKSTTSSGTTIVKKTRRVGGRPAAATVAPTAKVPPAKKAAATAAGATTKTAASAAKKNIVAAEPAASRRVLRKRN